MTRSSAPARGSSRNLLPGKREAILRAAIRVFARNGYFNSKVADIARAVGRPQGFRAVGMANNRNPVAIVVPCHRVIATDGTLCGYGGGLEIKRQLLELEGALSGTLAA